MKGMKFDTKRMTAKQKECFEMGFNFLNARLHRYGFTHVDTYDSRVYYYTDDTYEYMFYIIFPTDEHEYLRIETTNKFSTETLKEIADLLVRFSQMSENLKALKL